MTLNTELFLQALPLFARASVNTITIALFSTCIGLCGGTLLALAQQSNNTLLRWGSSFYIAIIRGTPMIVQIVLLYYGLNLPFPPIVIAILAIGLNSSAYISQTIKTGIDAIAKGELEAAKVMGLTRYQITRFIILPQAFRTIFPSLGNEFVTLIKDSSLAYIIGVHELFKESRNLMNVTYDVLTIYAAVTVFYLVLTYTATLLLKQVSQKWETPC